MEGVMCSVKLQCLEQCCLWPDISQEGRGYYGK